MSIAIHTPKKLILKHWELFAISLVLFFYGFVHGLQPEYAQPIIEQAKQVQLNPYDTLTNFRAIFVNNGIISSVVWLGWVLTPILGLEYFPPTIMVYNVGAAFGAVAGYVSAEQFLLTLASFGILEMLGLIFGMTAGLLFPKYVIAKILSKPAVFSEYAEDSLSFMFYSAIFLLAGAFLEALLLNPSLAIMAVILGIIATVLTIKYIYKGSI